MNLISHLHGLRTGLKGYYTNGGRAKRSYEKFMSNHPPVPAAKRGRWNFHVGWMRDLRTFPDSYSRKFHTIGSCKSWRLLHEKVCGKRSYQNLFETAQLFLLWRGGAELFTLGGWRTCALFLIHIRGSFTALAAAEFHLQSVRRRVFLSLGAGRPTLFSSSRERMVKEGPRNSDS